MLFNLILLSQVYEVTFTYKPEGQVQSVSVAGSFNNWDANANPMKYDPATGEWKATLYLPEGTYEYKFVINGKKWVPDPKAKEFKDDGYGGKNSVIKVDSSFPKAKLRKVTLKFTPPISGVKSVSVAGTFNNWNPNANPMSDDDGDGTWEITLYLPPGEYQYKFVVNGEQWLPDPKAEKFVDDGFGGKNSVLIVRESSPSAEAKKGDGKILRDMVVFKPSSTRFAVRIGNKYMFKIMLSAGDVERAYLIITTEHRKVQAAYWGTDGFVEMWKAEVKSEKPFRFYWVLEDGRKKFYVGKDAKNPKAFKVAENPSKVIPMKADEESIYEFRTPSWVWEAVFYQIFPERFRNGDPTNDPPGVKNWVYARIQPWWEKGESEPFYGGDLKGIIQSLDYLKELGVTAIYLNPIFKSLSSHKYDIIDYYEIDPHFGTKDDFKKLLIEAHKRGIKIILDGVFNHTADEFWAFQDVKEKGPASKYYNWYYIKKWPFPKQFSAQDPPSKYYECWWGFGDLPKLNMHNPETRKYILGVAKYWIEFGADGWRLDVPNEVPDDFWPLFRKAVKEANPDAYIVGEIWTDASKWLKGDMFDGVMNYPLRNAVINYVVRESLTPSNFARQIYAWQMKYPDPAVWSLLDLLSSHDTPRYYTVTGKDMKKTRLGVIIQFTVPGAPSIYYGEEIGMEGDKDPDNRRVFPWNDKSVWNLSLQAFYKKLIRIRKAHPALRTGQLVFLKTESKGNTAAYARVLGEDRLIIVLNDSNSPQDITIDAKGYFPKRASVKDLITGKSVGRTIAGKLSLYKVAPKTGYILVAQ